jgi:hypothetical protein
VSECDRLRHLSDTEAMSDPGLLLHAETCPDCRTQLSMDGRLRDLTPGMPRSELSPGFNGRLRTMLATEKEKQHEKRRRLLLLQTYWVIAATASIIVLTQVHWPSSPPAPSVYVLGSVLVTAFVGPVLLLLRRSSGLAGFLSCVFAGELNDPDEGPHS